VDWAISVNSGNPLSIEVCTIDNSTKGVDALVYHIGGQAAGARPLRQAYEWWKAGADPVEWAKYES